MVYTLPSSFYREVNTLVYREKKFPAISRGITQDLLTFVNNHHDRGPFRDYFRDGRTAMRTGLTI